MELNYAVADFERVDEYALKMHIALDTTARVSHADEPCAFGFNVYRVPIATPGL